METQNDPETIDWYKQFWPWFLILLPGSVVVASIITIVIASSQPKDLIEDGFKKMGLSVTHEQSTQPTIPTTVSPTGQPTTEQDAP